MHFSFPVLEALDSDEVSGNCAEEQGYELNRRSETNDWGSEYDTRIRKQCMTSEWRRPFVDHAYVRVQIFVAFVTLL